MSFWQYYPELVKYWLMRYMYNDLLPPFDRQDVTYQAQNITPEINQFQDFVQ
ncbi:hypothetical protein [uncultured Trichococcus sp.]|uniref:hypothetical protein n=1 Tax=uncultured Trichococcus sp. TaxID=189665 RepID=UPI002A187FF0|nr:hypothetical protein [uncultured Trichococcus sp.]